MVGSTAQDVDLNTIPQGLIERIEVITGGAGATYGADAIAGAVNIIMKDDFEGVELRGTYANTIPEMDAREYQIAGTFGGNFDDGRGNLAVSVEYADRESLEKSQRAFAQQATSTTRTPPVGRLVESGTNAFTQAAVDAVFGSYAGVDPSQIPLIGQSNIHFNQDGTLFGSGIFNNPSDLVNYRYDPLGLDAAAANQNYVPDFYSYNFDLVNFLVLPLKRKSAFLKGNYEINEHFDVFVQGGYTEYQTSNALAPTPIGTRIYGTGTAPGQQFGQSDLIEGGQFITANVIPVTNPFIPADLAALLASRVGDDPRLVGAGALEPFQGRSA
jgi:outer membrane receptor protein involved in Fe transport